MDYFKILNLNREPFSNSPEPDFFYQSAQHQGCLQNLEIAIRLRRGLNVVMGKVGTGKTTLCRELLIRFAQSAEDRDSVEPHLVLDPATTTPGEFLTIIANAFGITDANSIDAWKTKEGIKDYLYQKGVVEQKTVVLLIDEGQKLPDFALEILRELLNYETNEFKLLQIVIFAQDEFKESMISHKNLADRVNQFINLGPLSFRETRQLIGLRIAQSSEAGTQVRLFTLPGMYAIYKFSGGYPRRIVNLCHQSMLAMIIQNRKRAGWSTVRSCAERVSVESREERRRWPLVAGSSLVVLLVVVAGSLYWKAAVSRRIAPAAEMAVAERGKAPAPVVAAPVAPASQPLTPVSQDFSTKSPSILGRIIIGKGETVYGILNRIYGSYEEEQLQAFVRANQRLKNIHRVLPGEVVTFPAVPTRHNPLPSGKSWVVLMVKPSLGEAYEALSSCPEAGETRLFPYWNHREGMAYAVLVKNGFSDAKEAEGFINQLPSSCVPGARVVVDWPAETEFYAR